MKPIKDPPHGRISFTQKAIASVYFLSLAYWVAGQMGWPAMVSVNATASMPRGVWARDALGTGHKLTRGQIVVAGPPERAVELGCVRARQVLLKYVVGVPGDRVCVRDGSIYLDEDTSPVAHTRRRPTGEPGLLPTQGCVVVSPGHVWLATPHPRSCDSRYFGQVERAQVRARASVLWSLETGIQPAPVFPPQPLNTGDLTP